MCCFAGDTKIKLANGKTKAIRDLKPGDRVRGAKGENQITKIHRPWLHFRKKYSINNGEYFTTAEHPFMTKFGWRAIKPRLRWYDPETWANLFHDHKDLEHIQPLQVGDKIITEKGQIEVQSISSSWNLFKWFERVYNISLDNDNTYYADGFLVHNKGGGGIGKIFRPITNIFKKIVKAVVNVFSGFMGAFGMSFDTPDMGGGGSYEAESEGITVNKQSNVAGIPVIYGERKVGGTRVWAGTTGEDNKYLYVTLAVAEGEIEGFTGLYIDDEYQEIDSFPVNPTDDTTVKVKSGSKYYVNGEPRAEFQFFTGAEDQKASKFLYDNHPEWTDSHRLQGVAYVACRFEWVKPEYDDNGNQTRFNPWRGMPTINVVIKGKKVLTGDYSGHGTTNTNTYGSDLGSFAYSTNPADCLLDYLRSPRYGKGLTDNRIDWGEFRQAQVICGTTTNFPIQKKDGSIENISQAFLDCNTYVKPEDNIFQNTKKLLQTCRGFLPYTNGRYQLRIETADTTPENLLNINDSMIIGQIQIQSPDKNSKYNEAHITYSNKAKRFEPDTVVVENSTYKSEDSGETLTLTMGAPGITAYERAAAYARYMVNRSRRQLQVQIKCTSEAQQLVAGELCTITHTYNRRDDSTSDDIYGYMFRSPNSTDSEGAYNYTDPKKIFRVVAQKLNYDGTVDLTLMEHQNNIYAVATQQEDTDLNAYNDFQGVDDNKKPPEPSPPDNKHFTVSGRSTTVNGVARPYLFINNNQYETVDARAIQVIYNITMGSNQLSNPADLPNHYGSGFNNINGTPIPFGATITVSISSKYATGQINFIESHTITMPADPSAEATGSI